MSRDALLAALTTTENPVLRRFGDSWDRSLAGLQQFRAGIDGYAEPTSIRDEADDFLDDLERAMRADS